MMRIVFMGTPEFAVPSLDILVKNKYEIVGVVTVPDKAAGRGQKLQQSAVKQYAIENNIKVLQPTNLKDQDFVEALRLLKADLQIVVAFRMLPEVVWNMPKHGTYNLHASLLPQYRGAAPINRAIMNGEKETGATTFKLKHEIDTGNVLFFEKVEIGSTTTAGELHDELKVKGASLVLKTVREIEKCEEEKREPNFMEQNESKVSHAPKIFKSDCRINWNESAEKINNLIRGLSPFPTAYTELAEEKGTKRIVKIYRANYEVLEHTRITGFFITEEAKFLKIFCRNGFINVLELQMEGKRKMKTEDFLKGFKFAGDARFE
jgi:methionyl-tRNA formyltransferase